MQWRRKLQLQNRISTPKRQKDDFEALFQRNCKRKITSAKIATIFWQITVAAWMQPLQYDLQSSAAKDDSITHAAAAPSNLDAAITMRFAASRRKLHVPTHITTPEHQMTTVMQPFQCDLPPEIPKHPITTHTQAHPKQLQATVTLRQKKTTNRPQPHPSHTRGSFHRRLQPLYTEKHKVSCSGFLPKT